MIWFRVRVLALCLLGCITVAYQAAQYSTRYAESHLAWSTAYDVMTDPRCAAVVGSKLPTGAYPYLNRNWTCAGAKLLYEESPHTGAIVAWWENTLAYRFVLLESAPARVGALVIIVIGMYLFAQYNVACRAQDAILMPMRAADEIRRVAARDARQTYDRALEHSAKPVH